MTLVMEDTDTGATFCPPQGQQAHDDACYDTTLSNY